MSGKARKRWKTRVLPTLTEQRHPSQVAAYRAVAGYREDRRLVITRARTVVVYVSEGKGPWQTYERVDLGEPEVRIEPS